MFIGSVVLVLSGVFVIVYLLFLVVEDVEGGYLCFGIVDYIEEIICFIVIGCKGIGYS